MKCGNCKDVVEGAVGVAKAVLRIDRADAATIKMRNDKCANCVGTPIKATTTCPECKCLIGLKILIRSEACPLPDPAWPAVST